MSDVRRHATSLGDVGSRPIIPNESRITQLGVDRPVRGDLCQRHPCVYTSAFVVLPFRNAMEH